MDGEKVVYSVHLKVEHWDEKVVDEKVYLWVAY